MPHAHRGEETLAIWTGIFLLGELIALSICRFSALKGGERGRVHSKKKRKEAILREPPLATPGPPCPRLLPLFLRGGLARSLDVGVQIVAAGFLLLPVAQTFLPRTWDLLVGVRQARAGGASSRGPEVQVWSLPRELLPPESRLCPPHLPPVRRQSRGDRRGCDDPRNARLSRRWESKATARWWRLRRGRGHFLPGDFRAGRGSAPRPLPLHPPWPQGAGTLSPPVPVPFGTSATTCCGPGSPHRAASGWGRSPSGNAEIAVQRDRCRVVSP